MKDLRPNAAESLALINRMIENTRSRMARDSGKPFLVWGYATVACTLLVWAAVAWSGDVRWNLLWMLLPAAGWLGMRLTRPDERAGTVRTHVDRIVDGIWFVLGTTVLYLMTVAYLLPTRLPMLFVVLLLMGAGTALTGLVIRFRPGMAGGAAGILLAPLLLLEPLDAWHPLLFAAGFAAMMIVPGHLLNRRTNPAKEK